MDIPKLFEELYVKNAPSWSIERDPDGSYKYHATQSAFVLFENQQLEIESLKSELAKAQAVTEGFILVPTENVKFFSHDFNGGGFQYHDTLLEAKKASEADLDIYRDRVADGNHIADMGEFNELAYGIVVGQAEWSVDCVVSADDHKNGEYTQYGIGTEILSLYLSEAQEQSHE